MGINIAPVAQQKLTLGKWAKDDTTTKALDIIREMPESGPAIDAVEMLPETIGLRQERHGYFLSIEKRDLSEEGRDSRDGALDQMQPFVDKLSDVTYQA